MDKQSNQIEYQVERENYKPHDVNKTDPVFKKIKLARRFLMFGPIVHLGTCVIFLVLLLIGLIAKSKLGFPFTSTQFAIAFSYVGFTILVDLLVFMFPAWKANKKNQFRIMVILTLIFSTLILSGSLYFWVIPTLLFYSVVTLIVWIFEVIAAIYLMLAVEALPN